MDHHGRERGDYTLLEMTTMVEGAGGRDYQKWTTMAKDGGRLHTDRNGPPWSGGGGGTTIVRFEPEIIIMLPFMLYIYCVQMQHVLARSHLVPKRSHIVSI